MRQSGHVNVATRGDLKDTTTSLERDRAPMVLRRTVLSIHNLRSPTLLISALLVLSAFAGSPVAEASVAHATAPASLKVEPLRVAPGVTYSQLTFLGCASVRYCAAGGSSTKSRLVRATMSSEADGVWGPLQNVGPAVTNGSSSEISAVACPAPGSCVAVGNHSSTTTGALTARSSSFMITQKGPEWSSPQPIPLSGSEPHSDFGVTALQCPSKNFCVIIGLDDVSATSQLQFAQTWQGGKWGSPHFFSPSELGDEVTTLGPRALSCPTTSWCIEVGRYETASGRITPFDATLSKGQWGPMTSLTAYRDSTNDNSLTSVSCVAAGTCVATGASQFGRGDVASVPLIMSESDGQWAPARTLAIPGITSSLLDPTQVPLVSCVGDMDCTGMVASRFTDGITIGVATLRSSGQWSAVRINDLDRYTSPTLLALSCFKSACVGIATAAGPASGPSRVPLVVTASGAW